MVWNCKNMHKFNSLLHNPYYPYWIICWPKRIANLAEKDARTLFTAHMRTHVRHGWMGEAFPLPFSPLDPPDIARWSLLPGDLPPGRNEPFWALSPEVSFAAPLAPLAFGKKPATSASSLWTESGCKPTSESKPLIATSETTGISPRCSRNTTIEPTLAFMPLSSGRMKGGLPKIWLTDGQSMSRFPLLGSRALTTPEKLRPSGKSAGAQIEVFTCDASPLLCFFMVFPVFLPRFFPFPRPLGSASCQVQSSFCHPHWFSHGSQRLDSQDSSHECQALETSELTGGLS